MNEELMTIFTFNNYCLNKNLQDISNEESLKSPEPDGNCINWITGHIVVTRDFILEELEIDKLCNERITGLYIRGAEPIKPGTEEDFASLLKIYNDSQEKIMKALTEIDFKEDIEKRKSIAGLGFHEAYHVGQTGILRRILGKSGLIK